MKSDDNSSAAVFSPGISKRIAGSPWHRKLAAISLIPLVLLALVNLGAATVGGMINVANPESTPPVPLIEQGSIAEQPELPSAGPDASNALVSRSGPVNFNAVAILRWYPANLTTTFGPSGFSLPSFVAFDGANIWVTNGGNSTVTKVQASDGFVLGTFNVPAGADYVAFDGANIWVTNGSIVNPSVTKLRASDGALLGTFNVGGGPVGVALTEPTYGWQIPKPTL